MCTPLCCAKKQGFINLRGVDQGPPVTEEGSWGAGTGQSRKQLIWGGGELLLLRAPSGKHGGVPPRPVHRARAGCHCRLAPSTKLPCYGTVHQQPMDPWALPHYPYDSERSSCMWPYLVAFMWPAGHQLHSPVVQQPACVCNLPLLLPILQQLLNSIQTYLLTL